MPGKLRIAMFVHALRSDWNNGNAHFLRGLARALGPGAPGAVGLVGGERPTETPAAMGHEISVFEPERNWSMQNLLGEPGGEASLEQFAVTYPDLQVETYRIDKAALRARLANTDVVLVHEWNSAELIETLLALRDELGYKALFHDTHHRASSSPGQLRLLQVARFDGVIAFGEALRAIYHREFGLERVWTLHEAPDTTVFYPRTAPWQQDVVWVGNWGEDERSQEIREFLVYPAAKLRHRRFSIYGVRYPQEATDTLAAAGIDYGGYLPNLSAPAAYAASRLTVHVPRQQYAGSMAGIPTIRVFEALASGIPLISAPWQDTEGLFGADDLVFVRTASEMRDTIELLLRRPELAAEQAVRGRRTLLARHTCAHRAAELTHICEEVLA